jgi:hypothetical protein
MDVNPADVQKLIVMPNIRLEVLERLVLSVDLHLVVEWYDNSNAGATLFSRDDLPDCRDYTAGKDMRRTRTGVYDNRRTSRVL